jgi:hypothetical protein
MEAGCSSRLAQVSLSSLGFLCVFPVIIIHAVILVPKQHTQSTLADPWKSPMCSCAYASRFCECSWSLGHINWFRSVGDRSEPRQSCCPRDTVLSPSSPPGFRGESFEFHGPSKPCSRPSLALNFCLEKLAFYTYTSASRRNSPLISNHAGWVGSSRNST